MLAIVGWPTDGPASAVGIGLLSGVCLGLGLALLYLGLKLGEASRAVAVSQTYPILVALLALGFLDETVSGSSGWPSPWSSAVRRLFRWRVSVGGSSG